VQKYITLVIYNATIKKKLKNKRKKQITMNVENESIKSHFDKIYLEFILKNSEKILEQSKNSMNFNLTKIQIFEEFTLNLEKQIQEYIKNNNLAIDSKKIVNQYYSTFYHSTLPNLVYKNIINS